MASPQAAPGTDTEEENNAAVLLGSAYPAQVQSILPATVQTARRRAQL